MAENIKLINYKEKSYTVTNPGQLIYDSDMFKLGVTANMDSRIKRGYHGLKYENISILFKSTGEIIAEIEYKVKLEFKDYICFGNEGFFLNKKDIILNYIKELIKLY